MVVKKNNNKTLNRKAKTSQRLTRKVGQKAGGPSKKSSNSNIDKITLGSIIDKNRNKLKKSEFIRTVGSLNLFEKVTLTVKLIIYLKTNKTKTEKTKTKKTRYESEEVKFDNYNNLITEILTYEFNFTGENSIANIKLRNIEFVTLQINQYNTEHSVSYLKNGNRITSYTTHNTGQSSRRIQSQTTQEGTQVSTYNTVQNTADNETYTSMATTKRSISRS
jgi:hypothetical protein